MHLFCHNVTLVHLGEKNHHFFEWTCININMYVCVCASYMSYINMKKAQIMTTWEQRIRGT